MDISLFFAMWSLALKLLWPILGAILLGALVAAFLRLWTQLDEPAISFVGRAAGLVLFFFVVSSSFFQPLLDFTQHSWSFAAGAH